ncbi:hypothetical protein PHET_10220 [Paragonimus heterotremus]|uniref:long-chain-fatty-acid--CoA ligase n=1 Tax=Paragonimus heterotremus TaxID=100268 RepID=A0A8J4T9W8_9TREM|nr:hypothetical protein PHET_10220 [Paragonimus heterotremus]
MIELILGEYSWETFGDAERRVSHIAAGLYSMLGPATQDKRPIAIFSETRAEWLFAAQAAFRLNRPLVTLYATLGEDALVHGLNEAEISVVITSDELLSKVIKIVQRCPNIKRIVYFTNGVFNRELYTDVDNLAVPTGSATTSVAEALTKAPSHLHLHDLIEVERLGAAIMLGEQEAKRKAMDGTNSAASEANDVHKTKVNAYQGLWMPPMAERPKPSDLAIIMYTSGSTDTSSRIKQGHCKGDITLLRPTLFASVPTVLERISKAVWEKVNAGGEFSKALFRFAYDYKCRRIHGGFPSFLVDRLIFRRVRSLMGGRIRYIVSGGAPLSEDSQLFANICLAPIIQGRYWPHAHGWQLVHNRSQKGSGQTTSRRICVSEQDRDGSRAVPVCGTGVCLRGPITTVLHMLRLSQVHFVIGSGCQPEPDASG